MNIKSIKYNDDKKDFYHFLDLGHPYFKISTIGSWCLLKYIHLKNNLINFRVLSNSNPKEVIPGASDRELKYFYFDNDLNINVEGNISVIVVEKPDENDYHILTIDFYRFPIGTDDLSHHALKITSIERRALPLYMINIQKGFETELRKI